MGIHSKSQQVPAGRFSGFHDQGRPELGPAHAHACHLQVRNRDVEIFGKIGVPHEAHICYEKRTQIALVGREIPNAIDFAVDLFVGQEDELFFSNDGRAEFELSVEFRCLVGCGVRWQGGGGEK